MSRLDPDLPNRLVMTVVGLDPKVGLAAAYDATWLAKRLAPKLTGTGASLLRPFFFGEEFGIEWPDEADHMWMQEVGIGPFTMRTLAGKTVPMWIDDPTGSVARENPKAETRITASGKRQVKIFRRVGKIGATKRVRTAGGAMRTVPQSYPGAPGRIATREVVGPFPPGRMTGRIASPESRPHVGVRWRHPGLHARSFMHHALLRVAAEYRLKGRIAPGYGAVR